MPGKPIATTRFTTDSHAEFNRYGAGHDGVHWYGTPKRAPLTIDMARGALVIEMNNTQNSVEGLGLIVEEGYGGRQPIYSEPNWCRHTYRREAWLSPEEVQEAIGEENWAALHKYLFKSIHNQKRWSGITGWKCHDAKLEAALLALREPMSKRMDAARLRLLSSAEDDHPVPADPAA